MKPITLLSWLAATSSVLSAKTTSAQTYQPSNRIPLADNTLGTQVSGSGNNFAITGGLNRGQTLFHSFTDFSIPTGGVANFDRPSVTRDIITRVTGNNFSDINGLINSNGANFFLINPNGITFGTNARLNVGKAFMATSAEGINLLDGTGRTFTFGKSGAGDAPLLSVNTNVLFNPSQLVMGSTSGQINNFGRLQTNNISQYIGLIGGNVKLDGGRINAPEGRVDLGGLSAFGTIVLGGDVNNLQVQFPSNVARGDVSLTNSARVNVAGAGGGDISIGARDLKILNGSAVRGGIETGSGTPEALAGNITIDATGEIAVVGFNSAIANNVRFDSKGNGGNITIDAGSLSILDGASLQALTSGTGNTGNVRVTAKDALLIGSDSYLIGSVESGAVGKSGNIDIQAGSLSLKDAGQIGTFTRGVLATQLPGQVNGGNINVKVTGAIDITGTKDGFPSAILSTVASSAIGNGGNIKIEAGSLSLQDGAELSAVTYGKGDSGKITIEAGSLSLRDGAKLSAVTYGKGDSGNIKIDAKEILSLDNKSLISSHIHPQAAGNSRGININTKDLKISNRSAISSDNFGGIGSAGSIKIKTAGDLNIVGDDRSIPGIETSNSPSAISSSTNGIGDTGKITVDVDGNLNLNHNGAISSVIYKRAKGNSQGIAISAKNLNLSNRSLISTSNAGGMGNGGNIDINAKNFSLNNSSKIFTDNLGGIGDAGDINIKTQGAANIFNNSEISSKSSGEGEAANISIDSKQLNLNNSSSIATDAISVSGGDLTIYLEDLLLLRNNSFITTTSNSTGKNGNGGNITINSPLIVATPGNNNITANANAGNGGKVNITSQGLFGIKYRARGQDSLLTNDITSSSTFGQDGTVNIDTPGTDPGKDSTELPNAPNDASNQISQVCSAQTRQNKLTVTGRGGMPPDATEPLTPDVVWQDARATSPAPTASNATTKPDRLPPPAVGWKFDGKGKVTLIAAGTPGQTAGTKVTCSNTRGNSHSQ